MRLCEVALCDRKHYAKGLCDPHYQRQKMGYDLTRPVRPMDPVERFWAYVVQDDATCCWNWQGTRDAKGYGCHHDRVFILAHRFAYQLLVGPIPKGLKIDHLCRNTSCVNPGHLEAVTQRVNVLRGEGIAAKAAKKTHCPQGHPYDAKNTRIYDGRRYCRACAREWKQRRRVSHAGFRSGG